MQQEWRQAVQGWQTYSQELAQLGERLDAHTWQRLLALLADCRGKIAVTGVGTSGIAARKIATCWPAWSGRRSISTPPARRTAIWASCARRSADPDLARRQFRRADPPAADAAGQGGDADRGDGKPAFHHRAGGAADDRYRGAEGDRSAEHAGHHLNCAGVGDLRRRLRLPDGAQRLRQERLLAVHPGGGVGKSLREEN